MAMKKRNVVKNSPADQVMDSSAASDHSNAGKEKSNPTQMDKPPSIPGIERSETPIDEEREVHKARTEQVDSIERAKAGANKPIHPAIEYLAQQHILRGRIDPDTGLYVYHLYHDYLSRAVLEAERRADRWPTVVREAQQAFADAGGNPWRQWWALLSLWQQIRLAAEWLRGRFRYGAARRFALVSAVRALPLLLIVTGLALGTWEYKRQQRIADANERARRLLAELPGVGDYPSPAEFEALRRLSESDEVVRLSALTAILETKEFAKRLRWRLPYILHAVVGLDSGMRDRVKTNLEAVATTPGPDLDINIAAADLGRQLFIDEPNFNHLVAANFVAAMEKATNSSELSSLGTALGSLGERLPAEQAAAVAGRIVAAMEKTTDSNQLYYLGSALGSLGERLPADQAAAVAGRIVAAMEKATDSNQLYSLGSALESLGERLPAEQAAALAGRIVAAMEKATDLDALSSLGDALGTLVAKLEGKDAMTILKSIVCVGEIRGIVLVGLEKKTKRGFNGDLWKAVKWAEDQSIDVMNLPRWPLNTGL